MQLKKILDELLLRRDREHGNSFSKSHGCILVNNHGILVSKTFSHLNIRDPEWISKMLCSGDLPYLLQKDCHALDVEK